MLSRIYFAAHRELHTRTNAGWDLNAQRFFSVNSARTGALGAVGLDLLARSVAGRAGCGGLHLPQNGIGNLAHHAMTTAGSASLQCGAVFSSCSVAKIAGGMFFNLDFLAGTFAQLLHIQLELDPQVGAPLPATTATAAATTTATSSPAKKGFKGVTLATKNVAELRENVIHRHSLAGESTATASHALMPKAVVSRPLIPI